MADPQIIRVVVEGPQGPQGDPGEVNPLTLAARDDAITAANAAASVTDVIDLPHMAAAALLSMPATRKAVRLLGYAAVSDGGGAIYKRVASQPSHAGKFRSTDRVLPNGATDSASGGWWEIAETVLRPQMFGVLGAGNEATAFQAAITTAVTLGRQLHLGGGLNITLGSTISLPSGLVITGDKTCRLLKSFNAGHLLHAAGASNIRLSGFEIDGQWGTYTDYNYFTVFIDWTSVAGSNVVIRDIDVRNTAGSGITALASSGTPSSNLRILNCVVENAGTHGIIAQDYISDVEVDGCTVKNTSMFYADRPGITLGRNGTGAAVRNCTAVGSPSALGTSTHGISIDQTTGAVATGNRVLGWTKGAGIEVGFVDGGVFESNYVEGCKYGIIISGYAALSFKNKDVSVGHNRIRNCVSHGIYSFMTSFDGVFMHENISIVGNDVSGCQGVNAVGFYIECVDGLTLDVASSCNNAASGAFVYDCVNWNLDVRRCSGNNTSGGAKSVTSVIQATGTATATVVCNSHNYTTGDYVTLSGAYPSEVNVEAAQITVVDSNTFTLVLPRSGLTTTTVSAAGRIKAIKAAATSHAGVKIGWSGSFPAGQRGTNRIGYINAHSNGFRNIETVSLNEVSGLVRDALFMRSRNVNPRVENLTSGATSNINDGAAIYMKSGKIVIAYNNSGTLTYITANMDGLAGSVTWTASTTAP